MKQEEIHFYEVIVENRPCHLYFDVEYHIDEHPEYEGNEMIERIISLVQYKFLEVFGIDDCEYELIHLDATTPTKFSRHLIFRSDKFCFRNNRQVSEFVNKEILTDPQASLIVDPAVYSRNRNFRCIWSTKFANGKNHPLLPLDGTNQSPRDSSEEFFRKTLITNVGPNPHCIEYFKEDENSKPNKGFIIDIHNSSNGIVKIQQFVDNNNYSSIEQFALSKFAPSGEIRSAQYSPQFNTLTYIIKNCRYCHRIGREHKSNSIYLVVRLSSGTVVQRCFDPDCRGFESDPAIIPDNILQQLVNDYTLNPKYNQLSTQPQKIKNTSNLAEYKNENNQT